MLKKLSLALALSLGTFTAQAADFKLTSPDIAEGQSLKKAQEFQGFGCDGSNASPALTWSGAPAGTKSYVITAYDPDAPTGSGWWHWVAYNIPASVSSIASGASLKAMPKGTVEARTDYGAPGFGGACPPPGEVHRYIFTVHALGVPALKLDENASPALIGYMTGVHRLGKASITAVYTR